MDFCSPAAKLVIELDGRQHLQQSDQDAKRSERSEFLQSQGYRVVRFWNNDVLNDIDGVVRAIQQTLSET